MRLVLIYLGRRGAGPVYSLEMAKALSIRNKLLLVVSSYSTNIEAWREFAKLTPTVTLLEVKTYTNKLQFLISFFKFVTFYKIIHAINDFKAVALYSTMPHFWEFIVFPFVKTLKVKTIHDVNMHLGDKTVIMQKIRDHFMVHADKIILLSKIFIPDVIKKGIKEDNIGIIPHANYSYYGELNKISISTKYNNRILFFGRIVKYKGIEVLLDAMKIVSQKCPDLKLRIVGSGNIKPYLVEIEELGQSIELEIGYIPEEQVSAYFEDIDFVVLPYLEATQSGVIPLSYSLGKPVIATCVGGLPEQVFDGTGIIIPPGDSRKLAEAILALVSDRDLLFQMSGRAKYIAETELSWNKSAYLLEGYICKWLNLKMQ